MAGEHLVIYGWCLSGLPIWIIFVSELGLSLKSRASPRRTYSSSQNAWHAPRCLFTWTREAQESSASQFVRHQEFREKVWSVCIHHKLPSAVFCKAVKWVHSCFQFISKGFCIFRSALRLAGGLARVLGGGFSPSVNTNLSRGIFILRLFSDASEEETEQLEHGGEREGGGL